MKLNHHSLASLWSSLGDTTWQSELGGLCESIMSSLLRRCWLWLLLNGFQSSGSSKFSVRRFDVIPRIGWNAARNCAVCVLEWKLMKTDSDLTLHLLFSPQHLEHFSGFPEFIGVSKRQRVGLNAWFWFHPDGSASFIEVFSATYKGNQACTQKQDVVLMKSVWFAVFWINVALRHGWESINFPSWIAGCMAF